MNLGKLCPLTPKLFQVNYVRFPQILCVTSHNVGQLRGNLEGFCALHLKLGDFFTLLPLKPKSDRFSLRGGMVDSQSAKELDMNSFDLLLVGIDGSDN
jgi:hypothetical protein